MGCYGALGIYPKEKKQGTLRILIAASDHKRIELK
jgi:hypothetical protein